MATTNKKKKKRAYNDDPKKKIEAGKPWRYNYTPSTDVANAIIEEQQNSNGAEFGKIIDSRLRKAYKLK
jgi:hypothetical protein